MMKDLLLRPPFLPPDFLNVPSCAWPTVTDFSVASDSDSDSGAWGWS